MPYIDPDDRQRAPDPRYAPRTPGELNYALTLLLKGYLERKGKNYTHLNDCLGALEGAKLEFFRRVVTPYENSKLAENGDVY
jgi:hypothetical protein